MYCIDHNKILHMSRQCNCRDMCKISLRSVEHILNYSTPNFCWISNWIEIPLMAPGPGPHWFLVVRCHLWACWPLICKLSAWGLQHVGLTQLPVDKMAAISQTTFWNVFSWTKIIVSRLKFHWNLFLSVQLIIFQYWFRKWLGADQATSHYLKQCCPSSPMHICITGGRWVNTLVPGRCGNTFKSAISKHKLQIKFLGTSCEIVHWWMPRNTFDDKYTLV